MAHKKAMAAVIATFLGGGLVGAAQPLTEAMSVAPTTATVVTGLLAGAGTLLTGWEPAAQTVGKARDFVARRTRSDRSAMDADVAAEVAIDSSVPNFVHENTPQMRAGELVSAGPQSRPYLPLAPQFSSSDEQTVPQTYEDLMREFAAIDATYVEWPNIPEVDLEPRPVLDRHTSASDSTRTRNNSRTAARDNSSAGMGL